MCFDPPQTLKTGCRPASDKIVSAINVYFWRPFSLEM